jgi:hypothetical protein
MQGEHRNKRAHLQASVGLETNGDKLQFRSSDLLSSAVSPCLQQPSLLQDGPENASIDLIT